MRGGFSFWQLKLANNFILSKIFRNRFDILVEKGGLKVQLPTTKVVGLLVNDHIFDRDYEYNYYVDINGLHIDFVVSLNKGECPEHVGNIHLWWNWKKNLHYISLCIFEYYMRKLDYGSNLHDVLDTYACALYECCDDNVDLALDIIDVAVKELIKRGILKKCTIVPDYVCGAWIEHERPDNTIDVYFVDDCRMDDRELQEYLAKLIEKNAHKLLKNNI